MKTPKGTPPSEESSTWAFNIHTALCLSLLDFSSPTNLWKVAPRVLSRVSFSSHITYSPPAISSISMAPTKSHMFTPKPVSKPPTVPPSSSPPYLAVYRTSPKPYLPRLIPQPVQNYPSPPHTFTSPQQLPSAFLSSVTCITIPPLSCTNKETQK